MILLNAERLLNQCIYDMIDAITDKRRDFLSRMGIESTWKPFKERSITRHDLINVVHYWWINRGRSKKAG